MATVPHGPQATNTDRCWLQHRKGNPPCFVNRNTKPAKVLHPLLARDNNCEAFFCWDKGLLGDGVRKGGTWDAPRHSQVEQNCWISPSYFKIKPLMLWLQVEFPAGQLLWISWPPAKMQRCRTERLLSATEVSPGPASTSSCHCRSRTLLIAPSTNAFVSRVCRSHPQLAQQRSLRFISSCHKSKSVGLQDTWLFF